MKNLNIVVLSLLSLAALNLNGSDSDRCITPSSSPEPVCYSPIEEMIIAHYNVPGIGMISSVNLLMAKQLTEDNTRFPAMQYPALLDVSCGRFDKGQVILAFKLQNGTYVDKAGLLLR